MSAGTLSTGTGTHGRGSPARPRSLQLTWLVASREIRIRAKTRVFVITSVILLIAVALAVGSRAGAQHARAHSLAPAVTPVVVLAAACSASA